MNPVRTHDDRLPSTRRVSGTGIARADRRAFTLIEWLVVVAIMAIIISMSVFTFRAAAEQSVLAQARNALVTYMRVAQSYAVANQIETMLVVNPYNGRFEVWYLNPPTQGGSWDPLSGGTVGVDPENTDGYAFAPILDPAASLPLIPGSSNNEPAVIVCPIDYSERPHPAADPGERHIDNLTWSAFCFDSQGQLVIRTRRIATRTYTMRDGTVRAVPNRLKVDGSPDLTMRPLVDVNDTPITSTRGFVISEARKMRAALAGDLTPDRLVNRWLAETREDGKYSMFADALILNRYSGQELTGAR